jgi:predicted transglutaminase-like cysteine proteinase
MAAAARGAEHVNEKIRAAAFLTVTDIGWHYPRHHMGDCVQYALLKRHELLMRGWPSGALHLTTAVTPQAEGHLVLVVSTNEGDWVLDNLHANVVPWESLPYRWVARQQGPSFKDWVSVAQLPPQEREVPTNE